MGSAVFVGLLLFGKGKEGDREESAHDHHEWEETSDTPFGRPTHNEDIENGVGGCRSEGDPDSSENVLMVGLAFLV